MAWFTRKVNGEKQKCKTYLRKKQINDYTRHCKNYKPNVIDKVVLANYYEKLKRTLKKTNKKTYVEEAMGKAKNFANRKEKAEALLQKSAESFEEAEKTLDILKGVTNNYKKVEYSNTLNSNTIQPKNVLAMFNAATTEESLSKTRTMILKAFQHATEASKLLENAPSNSVSKEIAKQKNTIKKLESLYNEIEQSIQTIREKASTKEEDRKKLLEKRKRNEEEEERRIQERMKVELKPQMLANLENKEIIAEVQEAIQGKRKLTNEEANVLAEKPSLLASLLKGKPRSRKLSNGTIVPAFVEKIEAKVKKQPPKSSIPFPRFGGKTRRH